MTYDDSLDDRQVIAAVLGGQSSLFDVIVKRYQRPLFHVAYSRLSHVELADEAVQETFLAAYRYLSTYNAKYSFRTWLWTILFNQCKQVANRTRRARQFIEEDTGAASGRIEQVEDPDLSPSQHVERREQFERLHDWFEDLPELEADALRLRFFGQLKFQEIADAQGCSLATAKNRVRRGLEGLGRRLESEQASADSVHSTTSDEGVG